MERVAAVEVVRACQHDQICVSALAGDRLLHGPGQLAPLNAFRPYAQGVTPSLKCRTGASGAVLGCPLLALVQALDRDLLISRDQAVGIDTNMQRFDGCVGINRRGSGCRAKTGRGGLWLDDQG